MRALKRHEDVETTDRDAHLASEHLRAGMAAAIPPPSPAVCHDAPVCSVSVAHAEGAPPSRNPSFSAARDARFERATLGFGDPRSIQLS